MLTVSSLIFNVTSK